MGGKNNGASFLFDSNKFLEEAALMHDYQVGKYIKLICIQSIRGHISNEQMLAVCGYESFPIYSNFIQDEYGLYYNERIDKALQKRRKKAEPKQ